jgi:hypothetical protein
MTNPSHQSKNARKKGKNRNNNNPGLGGNQNQPQQNQPAGGNQNTGNQNPQGGDNKSQGKNNNNIRTNFPCSLCGEFGHYTHHCPQIVDFERMKESVSGPRPLAPPAPQQAPQQYVQQPPPAMLQNPIPQQGVMNTQQDMQPTLPQIGQYPNPGNPIDRTILLTSEEEVLLQTRSRQYSATPESAPTTLDTPPFINGPPLMIPHPNTDPPLHIPRIPLRRNFYNPQARVAHNYSLVDDLAQSPAAM